MTVKRNCETFPALTQLIYASLVLTEENLLCVSLRPLHEMNSSSVSADNVGIQFKSAVLIQTVVLCTPSADRIRKIVKY